MIPGLLYTHKEHVAVLLKLADSERVNNALTNRLQEENARAESLTRALGRYQEREGQHLGLLADSYLTMSKALDYVSKESDIVTSQRLRQGLQRSMAKLLEGQVNVFPPPPPPGPIPPHEMEYCGNGQNDQGINIDNKLPPNGRRWLALGEHTEHGDWVHIGHGWGYGYHTCHPGLLVEQNFRYSRAL